MGILDRCVVRGRPGCGSHMLGARQVPSLTTSMPPVTPCCGLVTHQSASDSFTPSKNGSTASRPICESRSVKLKPSRYWTTSRSGLKRHAAGSSNLAILRVPFVMPCHNDRRWFVTSLAGQSPSTTTRSNAPCAPVALGRKNWYSQDSTAVGYAHKS